MATRPLADMDNYIEQLQQFVYHSGAFMKPLFAASKRLVREGGKSRVVFTEGEDERVLRAVQVVVDEGLAKPILVGRPAVLAARIERLGLRIRLGEDVEVTNPEYDERFHRYWTTYWEPMRRRAWHHQGNGARGDASPPDADRRDDGAPAAMRTPWCAARWARMPTTCASWTK